MLDCLVERARQQKVLSREDMGRPSGVSLAALLFRVDLSHKKIEHHSPITEVTQSFFDRLVNLGLSAGRRPVDYILKVYLDCLTHVF